MLALARAVVVWSVILASALFPHTPATVQATTPVVTQIASHGEHSVLANARAQRLQAAQVAQANAWSLEFSTSYDTYQGKIAAEAAATAEANRIAALSNHPPPPPYIAKIINDAFSPLGPAAVQWAINVAYCESRYHPNSVNTSSGASGLFQFLLSTWGGTPWHASSPFDPVANASAAAWLYSHYGPGRWVCQG